MECLYSNAEPADGYHYCLSTPALKQLCRMRQETHSEGVQAAFCYLSNYVCIKLNVSAKGGLCPCLTFYWLPMLVRRVAALLLSS